MSKVKTALQVAAVVGVGYLGVKAAMRIRDFGEKAPEAIKTAVVETLQAVNPVNQDNVFAQGANAVATKISGRETNLGGEVWEAVEWVKGKFGFGSKADTSKPSNVAQQIEVMELAQDNFRKSEIAAQNAAAEAAAVEEKMSNARSSFRLDEILSQNRAADTMPRITPPDFTKSLRLN